jgi:hypothetical protein
MKNNMTSLICAGRLEDGERDVVLMVTSDGIVGDFRTVLSGFSFGFYAILGDFNGGFRMFYR